MMRSLPFALGVAFAAGVSAQDIAGLKATLTAKTPVVVADATVDLQLVLEVGEDASVPAVLLNGLALEVTVDEADGPRIEQPGKGGAVPLAKGTRIERTISLPAARFSKSTASEAFSTVAVQWTGLLGANCVFRVAPDSSKIDLDALDLSKTKVMLLTNHGEMTLSFRPDKAPNHVMNFLKLAKSGFYDGTKFHRVINGFMIQGGDPNTKDVAKQNLWGQGNPGYTVDAEFNDIRHVRGVLSMARSQDPNSAGSQFFIVHKEAPHLDGKYTAFGNLVSGADTLDSIATTPTGRNNMPLEHVVLDAAVILPVYQ